MAIQLLRGWTACGGFVRRLVLGAGPAGQAAERATLVFSDMKLCSSMALFGRPAMTQMVQFAAS